MPEAARSDCRRMSLLCAAALLAALPILAGCAPVKRPVATGAADALSGKFTPYAYREDGTVLFVAVDTYAAHFTKKGDLFPLGLGIANHGPGALRFNREAFVLETSDGQSYPVVTNGEYARDYTRSRADLRLADGFLQSMRLRFRNYTYLPWNLFPTSGRTANTTDSIELPRVAWTFTYLYFPIPPEGIHDKDFTLLARTGEPEVTYVLHFRVE